MGVVFVIEPNEQIPSHVAAAAAGPGAGDAPPRCWFGGFFVAVAAGEPVHSLSFQGVV
jgi:hypothetical protein